MAADLLPSPEFAHTPHRRCFIKLSPRCGNSLSTGASVDPEPSWTLDDIFKELDVLESKLQSPFSKPESWEVTGEEEAMGITCMKPFVMCISDDDDGSVNDDDDHGNEIKFNRCLASGTRFSCKDLDFSESDDSDDESHAKTTHPPLMFKMSPEKGILYEYVLENQLKVKEDIRIRLSALDWDKKDESEKSSAVLFQLEKFLETRLARDRKLDRQYHSRIEEALVEHLTTIQRLHEQRYRIEELRIRDDASKLEEAKRKAFQEENMRKAKEEEEARLKAAKVEEEKQKAAFEAARKASEEAAAKEAAAKEAVAKEAARAKEVAVAPVYDGTKEQGSVAGTDSRSNSLKKEVAGTRTLAAESALKLEASRLHMHEEASRALESSVVKDFGRYERQIHKRLGQVTGTFESVRTKARELANIINDPVWPPGVSLLKFAEKVVSLCENQSANASIFARGHVIILLSSQVPAIMDFVLAQLHKSCIYTVPKYLQCSGSKTNLYYKMIGYREENGRFESTTTYLNRIENYMKLYAALVQTEAAGFVNPHGLKEGWAWLARFLNHIPVTRSSAYALVAFLEMAGFALWKQYRNQFAKILAHISQNFLVALKKKREQIGDNTIITRLENYLEAKNHLQEPEGRRLAERLSSQEYAP